MTQAVVEAGMLGQLIASLESRGYEVIGPTVQSGAVVYDTVEKPEDLPVGWRSEIDAAKCRLTKGEDDVVFGYVIGPQSWKKYLHPAEVCLFEARRENGGFVVINSGPPPPAKPFALLGVRACELAALAVLDRVLLDDKFADNIYLSRRRGCFIIAVNCTEAAPTCFCASMGTGPKAEKGYDLALTEILDGGRHVFLVETGSKAGEAVLAELGGEPAGAELLEAAAQAVGRAQDGQIRRIDQEGIREALFDNFEHPRWEQVSARCLSCTNCTQVCPTCFCTTVEDWSDVTCQKAARIRKSDSCFTLGFSYIHGGSVRMSAKARYRQWLTHKLAAWQDQFGSSGCVGCGRCITWCPVGIDITEEAAAIRGSAPTAA